MPGANGGARGIGASILLRGAGGRWCGFGRGSGSGSAQWGGGDQIFARVKRDFATDCDDCNFALRFSIYVFVLCVILIPS